MTSSVLIRGSAVMGSSLDCPTGNPKVLLGEERLLMTGHILWVWPALDIKWIMLAADLFAGGDGLISSEMWCLQRSCA